MLTKFVMKAVERVQPSSRMLDDSMDINEYVKVKLIESKDTKNSSYTNGTVLSKKVANPIIQTKIIEPRILLLEALATTAD